jgi:uncharacterized protein
VSWRAPQAGWLPGGRLHLQHGPIDLVIKAEGDAGALESAYAAAERRFQRILGELSSELPLLRQPLQGACQPVAHSLGAQRMIAACWPYRRQFITPMAAVAGAVADEIRDAMLAAAPLRTLYVNNGGDIAVHVAQGAVLRIGIVTDPVSQAKAGHVVVEGRSGIGGIATSGWRGRSFSLGIADAVTVVASSAAAADAAATMIANAVTVDHEAVERAAACSLDPDSDLRDLAVTIGVEALPPAVRRTALDDGLRLAQACRSDGRILAALLSLQGEIRICGSEAGLLEMMS